MTRNGVFVFKKTQVHMHRIFHIQNESYCRFYLSLFALLRNKIPDPAEMSFCLLNSLSL